MRFPQLTEAQKKKLISGGRIVVAARATPCWFEKDGKSFDIFSGRRAMVGRKPAKSIFWCFSREGAKKIAKSLGRDVKACFD